MDVCAVQGAFDPVLDKYKQSFDVHKDAGRDLVIAAIHVGYVGKDREGHSPAHPAFHLRADNLVKFLVEALKSGDKFDASHIKCALESAFERTDALVAAYVEEQKFEWPRPFLQTKFNSVVVLVHRGSVYTAGSTAEVNVLLARASEQHHLSSLSHIIYSDRVRLSTILPNLFGKFQEHEDASTILFYFCQERLTPNDAYVILCSSELWFYFDSPDKFLPVLQTRIDALGLKEACKSVVGRFKDRSKILIVVDLDQKIPETPPKIPRLHDVSNVHEKITDLRNRELSFAKKIGSSTQQRTESDDELDELTDDEQLNEAARMLLGYDEDDPLRYLQPLVNGKEQSPEPQTSTLYCTFGRFQAPCPETDIRVLYV